ncbi:ABC transporter ATP-binding protein [Nonomuraea sp. NN258]|uniref:ABC transporter ATP-binding protein n=1 Tax=Nonomuraea antri TaxID=2730852 RepID=UPI00156950B1|nr:ABC transporter ATP-binding protein [Nonomuraea antri]NRQ37586.1 ABC transporter ATP-binding protein [Nonomuraea antri]
MTAPLLSVRDVRYAYRCGPDVLHDVSFDVTPGRGLALVGGSGAGKTTLARLMLGLLRPTAGQVLLDGEPLPGRERALRRAVQPVFQDPYSSLDPRQRVDAIVAEPLRSLGLLPRRDRRAEARRRVAGALRAVGLPEEAARRYPHEFSGGQRQRIALARAIVCGPRALLADEPLSALDLATRVRLVDLLAELRHTGGLTLVLISHDLTVVAELCEQVVVLEGGRTVEQGDTRAVLGAPRHAYTRRLVESVPRLTQGPSQPL